VRIALSNASGSWGGVHLVTEVLARGLQARGHEVLVLCRAGSMLHERVRHLAPTAPVLRGRDLSPRAMWRAAREMRRFRTDALLTLMKKDVRLTAPVARLLGVPVVVRHAIDQPAPGGLFGRVLYGAVPAHHVTNALATRRTLLASAPWLHPDRVSVVYNGVDAGAIERADPEPLDLPEGSIAIGYIGSFEPRKGLLDLAAAWRRVAPEAPSAHLLLVGKGSQDALLRRELAEAPRVHFPGYRPRVAPLLRSLDLLVLPSYVEGVPNVALEAMAAGIPVVATAVSGTPEAVLDGTTGLLVPPRDPAALAEAILRLAGDPALRERMGRAGALRARRDFTLEAMLDRYEEILRRVSGREPGVRDTT